MAAFGPLGLAFEGHVFPPPVDTYRYVHTHLQNVKTISAQIISKSACSFSSAEANYITDTNKMFQSRSRGSLIDFDSDSDSAPLSLGMRLSEIILILKPKFL